MHLGLNAKRVLITAGAAGIGRAIAEAFAAEGAHVHVCDIDAGALASLRLEAGPAGAVTGAVCDVSDRAAVERFVASASIYVGGESTAEFTRIVRREVARWDRSRPLGSLSKTEWSGPMPTSQPCVVAPGLVDDARERSFLSHRTSEEAMRHADSSGGPRSGGSQTHLDLGQ